MDNGLNESGGWSIERKLLVATFVCSAIGFGFSVGFNWAKLTAVQTDVSKLQEFERGVPATYVPREVYAVQQQNLTDAITRLNVTLEKLQEQQRQADRPRIGTRIFDK